MRADIKVKQWSSMRGSAELRRGAGVLVMRMSQHENAALTAATMECSQKIGAMVRPTDVVRGCLIYCGVIDDELGGSAAMAPGGAGAVQDQEGGEG